MVGIGVATQTKVAAAIIAAVVTIVGLLITVRTTDRRQQRELAAAERRQQAQLDHERGLADREHFRDLLDQCATAYESAQEAVGEFTSRIVLLTEIPPWGTEPMHRLINESTPPYTALKNMRVLGHRLLMRASATNDLHMTYEGEPSPPRLGSASASSPSPRSMSSEVMAVPGGLARRGGDCFI